MLVPMGVLAIGAVLTGFGLVGMADNAWWNGALAVAQHGVHHDHPPVWALWLPFVCSLAGIALAAYFYLRHPDFPARVARALEPIFAFLLYKWYVDELYDVIIAQPVRSLANTLWQRGDVKGIDALGPNGVAQATQGVARILRPLQTGYVYHYAFAVMLALSMLLTWIVLQKV
jgi:NADH-quinone oxidoreductase subunit L